MNKMAEISHFLFNICSFGQILSKGIDKILIRVYNALFSKSTQGDHQKGFRLNLCGMYIVSLLWHKIAHQCLRVKGTIPPRFTTWRRRLKRLGWLSAPVRKLNRCSTRQLERGSQVLLLRREGAPDFYN